MANNLEQHLANLQISLGDSQSSKKIGPAVPPKPKKSQPQVPKSYLLNNPSEPSYSTLLQPAPSSQSSSEKDLVYTNILQSSSGGNHSGSSQSSSTATYSNIEPAQPQQLIYSNISSLGNQDINNTYSNVGAGLEDLPPPPPEPADYGQCAAANFPPPPDDLPPPPSPVSSSYSELRRATYQQNYQPEYGTYGPSSQSSTYESIYEPINPRPPSEVSSRSNYSLYAPYVSGSQSGSAQKPPPGGKEAEVDALTDLLVQSMDGSPDSDIYGDDTGVCSACGERVVGEGSGCTAMDQTYHITCFTCQHCAIQLQGKPFYALEGKPYCEEDYLNTLEKCSVCMKPILDRILRATGKPYHPQCFSCIVCGKSLDGIPFTVDATNQIHCIEDFHKKFAPRCCVCKLPIMPEAGQDETVRVVALDRSFHIGCYKCESTMNSDNNPESDTEGITHRIPKVLEIGEINDSLIECVPMPEEAVPVVGLTWRDDLPQIIACLAGASIVIQAGVNMAYSAILLPQLMASHSNLQITINQGSWIASLVTISTPFGSILSGTLMDKIGRKCVCKLTCIPLIISWIIVAFVHNVHALYFARILAGFGSGLSTAALMYISEVSHPKIRPMLLCLNSVFVSFGILLTCIFGLWMGYQAMAMTFAVISLISYLVILPLPESPYWLATFQNMKKTEISLRWLNRKELGYQQELKRLMISSKSSTPGRSNTFKLRLSNITKRSTIKPIIILIFLFLFQQLSGAYVIIFYAVNLFQMIGGKFGSGINEYGGLVLLGLIRFVMSIVASLASRRFGRRPLCIFSGLGMAISMLVAASYINKYDVMGKPSLFQEYDIPTNDLKSNGDLFLNNTEEINNNILNRNVSTDAVNIHSSPYSSHAANHSIDSFNETDYVQSNNMFNTSSRINEDLLDFTDFTNATFSHDPLENSDEHWIPLACILCYVSFSAIGFLVIPWTLAGELLPLSVRGTGGGFMIAFAYVIMFVVVKTFPYFLQIVKADGMCFVFSFTSFVGALFVYIFLPETLGKSFKEIEEYFS